jgi:D-aminoacyl-tRNA deacylase
MKTMILIAASTKDVASMNIANQIIERYDFEKLSETFQGNKMYFKHVANRDVKMAFTNQELIHSQHITEHFKTDLVIFVSRHASASGFPTLSVHVPGNLDKAELGGLPKRVSICPASAMKEALMELAKTKDEGKLPYEVSYECTHHGPSLDVPTMFVELGSSPEQWKDLKAAEAVAHAAMAAATKDTKHPTVLGVGGPHYNERFTKIALTTSRAFGHIISKYAAPNVEPEVIKQCVQRTVEHVESAVFDWKSLRAGDRNRIITALNELNVSTERA